MSATACLLANDSCRFTITYYYLYVKFRVQNFSLLQEYP